MLFSINRPDATGKEQFVFLYPNQFYYLRDDEENWFTGIQNWWQNQVQGATENSNSGGKLMCMINYSFDVKLFMHCFLLMQK